MEPLQLSTILLFIFLFLLLPYLLLKISRKIKKGNEAPLVPGAWPIVGHLHLLRNSEYKHLVLGAMADKYGPIFTIRLGLKRALIVNNWEFAKECLFNNDKTFSNRPKTIALDHMGYNHAMFGFSPYGPYWHKMRRITIHELLSKQGLAMLDRTLDSVVRTSIREIFNKWAGAKGGSKWVMVEMKKWLGDVVLDVIFRSVAGKKLREINDLENEKIKELVDRFFELIGVFTYGDNIPFLRHLDIGGFEKKMVQTGKEMDKLLSKWLEEHKRKRSSMDPMLERDFMTGLLYALDGDDESNLSNFDADTRNKATCMVLITGGIDSSTVTITWALNMIIKHPWALKTVQDELDTHVGRERQVNISDIEKLSYLQAIVKESLRLHPPSQLLPPREAIHDCRVGDYHVTAGTQLYANLWKIHRVPRIWPDPMEFKPERFLDTSKKLDVRGQNFEFLPFGSGRRVCPGITFALQVVHFALATLLHSFEFNTPSDDQTDDMDVTFQSSDIDHMPALLNVRLTPRLPFKNYG